MDDVRFEGIAKCISTSTRFSILYTDTSERDREMEK